MAEKQRIAPGPLLLHRAEQVRSQIQTTVLLAALRDIATGEKEAKRDQVAAAVALLRKALPDLQSIEVSGPDGAPLAITINKLAERETIDVASSERIPSIAAPESEASASSAPVRKSVRKRKAGKKARKA